MSIYDLDSEEEIADHQLFLENLRNVSRVAELNAPTRVAIGCWIAKGFLDSASAQEVLYWTDCYKVVLAGHREASLSLAQWIVGYFHKHARNLSTLSRSEMFLYKAQAAMLILTMHYTVEEQELVFSYLTEGEKFHD